MYATQPELFMVLEVLDDPDGIPLDLLSSRLLPALVPQASKTSISLVLPMLWLLVDRIAGVLHHGETAASVGSDSLGEGIGRAEVLGIAMEVQDQLVAAF